MEAEQDQPEPERPPLVGLSSEEAVQVYGPVVREAMAAFRVDPTYLVEMAGHTRKQPRG